MGLLTATWNSFQHIPDEYPHWPCQLQLAWRPASSEVPESHLMLLRQRIEAIDGTPSVKRAVASSQVAAAVALPSSSVYF